MQIFIARPDKNHGPYDLAEVNGYLASGHLTSLDIAWFEGCAGWLPLHQVLLLASQQLTSLPTPFSAPEVVPGDASLPPDLAPEELEEVVQDGESSQPPASSSPPPRPAAPPPMAPSLPPPAPPVMAPSPPAAPAWSPQPAPYPTAQSVPTFAPPVPYPTAPPMSESEETLFDITPSLRPQIARAVISLGLWLPGLCVHWLLNQGCHYRLTTQRLLVRKGLIAHRTEETELYRIKDVTCHQGLVGRLLGYGTVVILVNDASTPRIVLQDVDDPVAVKEQIRESFRLARRTEGVRAVEYATSR